MFITDATAETGFGHAARCARVAERLEELAGGIDIVFEGRFSDQARQGLENLSTARLVPVGATESSRVAVHDTMVDPENPEAWDRERFESARARAGHMIFMANGTTRPDLPDGVDCIGYKPGGPDPAPPSLRWGLEYAPVSSAMLPSRPVARDATRALVALGGAKDDRALRLALSALARIGPIAHIDILLSPVNRFAPDESHQRPGQTLEFHRNLPTVSPLLAAAGLVVASYGHLGYEALALGAPLCLVGQKRFQATYATRLAERGLCVAAGHADELDEESLAQSIAETMRRAPTLSGAARAAIDGRGLDRIAEIIAAKLAPVE